MEKYNPYDDVHRNMNDEQDSEAKAYFVEKVHECAQGYIQAALWCAIDSNSGGCIGDMPNINGMNKECADKIADDCRDFLLATMDFAEINDVEQAGMDFYFERHGYGVGFRDREYHTAVANMLWLTAKQYKEMDFWVENGEVFCE